MSEKNNQFSAENIKSLARSPAGQQLLAILQQSGGADLQQAISRAVTGDLEGAKGILAPLLADPKVQALLSQLGGV